MYMPSREAMRRGGCNTNTHSLTDILRAWAALLEGAAAAKKLASSALAAAAAAAKAHVDKSCFLLSGCTMHMCI